MKGWAKAKRRHTSEQLQLRGLLVLPLSAVIRATKVATNTGNSSNTSLSVVMRPSVVETPSHPAMTSGPVVKYATTVNGAIEIEKMSQQVHNRDHQFQRIMQVT